MHLFNLPVDKEQLANYARLVVEHGVNITNDDGSTTLVKDGGVAIIHDYGAHEAPLEHPIPRVVFVRSCATHLVHELCTDASGKFWLGACITPMYYPVTQRAYMSFFNDTRDQLKKREMIAIEWACPDMD